MQRSQEELLGIKACVFNNKNCEVSFLKCIKVNAGKRVCCGLMEWMWCRVVRRWASCHSLRGLGRLLLAKVLCRFLVCVWICLLWCWECCEVLGVRMEGLSVSTIWVGELWIFDMETKVVYMHLRGQLQGVNVTTAKCFECQWSAFAIWFSKNQGCCVWLWYSLSLFVCHPS